MSKWISSTLGGVSKKIITGPFGSQLHQSDYVSSGVAVIMPQNIGDRYVDHSTIAYISETDANRLSRYRVKTNDIVYSRRGDVEKHALVRESDPMSLCGTGCFLVRLDTNKVYPEYVSFYLNRPESRTWLRQHAVGSNMPNLNSEILNSVPFCYPQEIEKQKALVDEISSLDRKIQLNNTINAELEKIAKTLYNYWFMQFDFPNTDGKPYRASGGKMEYNEKLKREIPEGWEVTLLSSYVKEQKGGDWGKEENIGNYTDKVYCIRGADYPFLCKGGTTYPPIRYILPQNTEKKLVCGDLIIEISGGSPTQSTGRICYINEDVLNRFDQDIITSNFCRAISLNNQADLYLIYLHWKKLYESGILFNYESKTTGIKNLLFDEFVSSQKIIVFPENIKAEFNKFIIPIFSEIQKKIHESFQLTELRDFLLPLLMNGQVTVREE